MTKRITSLFVLLSFCVFRTVCSSAEAQDTSDDAVEANRSGQIILVVGASGADEYTEPLERSAARWSEVAKQSQTPIKMIGKAGEGKLNDREQLHAAIKSAASAGSGQSSGPLWLVMIGHGTFTRGVAKFNLRGPDVSAKEMAEWLQDCERPIVIVNCASASGPFVNQLSGENRIVVTATKSGTEHNYARFGEYFARAIASPDSDLDHDDEVSVHEAFLLASAEVRRFYEAEDRIITEHALIDDNGDGKGTPASMFRGVRPNAVAKDGAELDGSAAARVTLSPAGSRLPFTPEELEERASIEKELDVLRAKKEKLSEKEYETELEPLMLRLAKLYQTAEKRAAKNSR